MITFAPARVDREMLHRYQALFRACFPPSEKFTPNALEWLYADNPDGLVVGYDAIEGERLAAHYVCIPTTIRIDG
ncbi:MAG TPA: GNAT family N-acetyltransferase, partial [Gammaproteobacteria bacterium]|nr:GNAT family N-acetyltransferase [Gammaproteobacteria bacterium]